MRHPIRALFFTLVITVSLFTASSVLAIEYGGLGGKPAHPDPADSRTESWFILHADPSQVLDDELIVVNNTNEEKHVVLYPADSVAASGGGFALKQQGETMTGLGAWVTLSSAELTLPPLGQETVAFHVAIPDNATPGEHAGGVLIQEQNAEPIEAGNGMTLGLRMGVRIYLTVSGVLEKHVEFQDISTEVHDDTVAFTIPVVNLGNASVDITDGEVVITNTKTGAEVQRFSLAGLQVLQDSPLLFSQTWERPSDGGEYTISAHLSYKDAQDVLQSIAKETRITLDPLVSISETSPAQPSQKTDESFPSVIIGMAGTIGLFLGVIVGIFAGWRMAVSLMRNHRKSTSRKK